MSDWDAVRKALTQVIEDRSADQTMISVATAEQAAMIRKQAAPHEPRPIDDVIADAARIFSYRVRMDHPKFLGFIPSPASPLSLAGDVLTAGYNAHAGSWMQSSGPSAIEQGLIHWLGRQAGFPEGAGGLFVSGGSMANLTALMVARDRMLEPTERTRGIAYTSSQTHSSVSKGLRVLGFSPEQIRVVGVDADRRLDPKALRAAIAQDRADGLKPFVIVASCGTTNTGTIDDLQTLAQLAYEEGCWLHVDGAYGATIALSAKHRHLAEGLGLADSLSWDAHKWLFQTYGCGIVLVREQAHLRRIFANNAEYLQDASADDAQNFWDLGIELTRPARAMKLWFTLQVLGECGIGDSIDHGVALAEAMEAAIRERQHWRIISPAMLGIVTFRYEPPSFDAHALDELNSTISRHMVDGDRCAPLTTKLDGVVTLRACAISPNATVADMKTVAADLDQVARELVGRQKSAG